MNGKGFDGRLYFFLAAALSIFVPAPGRFSCGLALLVLFNLQIAVMVLFFHLSSALGMENFRNVLMTLSLVFVTILYKQLLALFCPVMALTLGFCMYLPALSTVAIQFFFGEGGVGLRSHLSGSLGRSAMFSAYLLLFFLIREVVGYSTVSLPAPGSPMVFPLPFGSGSVGLFLATIPGALALVAAVFAILVFVWRKFEIVRNSRENGRPSSGGER